jgi:hypothetical protein
MMRKFLISIFIGIFLGSIVGATSLSVVVCLYYLLITPDVLKDGQWGMVFLNTISIGAILGIATTSSVSYLFLKKNDL